MYGLRLLPSVLFTEYITDAVYVYPLVCLNFSLLSWSNQRLVWVRHDSHRAQLAFFLPLFICKEHFTSLSDSPFSPYIFSITIVNYLSFIIWHLDFVDCIGDTRGRSFVGRSLHWHDNNFKIVTHLPRLCQPIAVLWFLKLYTTF